MKKLFLHVGLICGLLSFAAGCSSDNTTEDAPVAQPTKFNVTCELQGSTEGISVAWASGDAAKLGILTETTGVLAKSSAVTISGSKATFSGELMSNESGFYCFYPWVAGATPTAVSFVIGAKRTQAQAGDALTGDQFPVVSERIAYVQGQGSFDVPVKAVPSIQRVRVFSSDAEFQSEIVYGVNLNAAEKINGTYVWDFTTQTGVVTQGENVSAVTLTTPYALTGIGAMTNAKPLYLVAAPVAVKAGYTYKVSTNKATYVYTVATAGTFAMGAVVNIDIDLKHATRNAKDLITFDASGLSAEACEATAAATDLGAFKALVNGTESTDYTKDYYKNLAFVVTDAEGNPATWATPFVAADGHISVSMTENPMGDERLASVEATFTSAEDYYFENPAFNFTVKQKGSVVVYDFTNCKTVSLNATAESLTVERDLGYVFAFVNGAIEKAPDTSPVYDFDFQIKDAEGNNITWLQAYAKPGVTNHIYLKWDANEGQADRVGVAKLYNKFGGEELKTFSVTIKQKGLSSPSVLTYTGYWTNSKLTPPAIGVGTAGDVKTYSDLGWYKVFLDGNTLEELTWKSYYELKYKYVDDNGQEVTWLSAKRDAPGDGNHVKLFCEPNNTGNARRAYIEMRYENTQYTTCADPALKLTILQGSIGKQLLTYTYGNGNPIVARQSGYNDWAPGTFSALIDGVKVTNLADPVYDLEYELIPAEASEWVTSIMPKYTTDPATSKAAVNIKMLANDSPETRTVKIVGRTKSSLTQYDVLNPVFTATIIQDGKPVLP